MKILKYIIVSSLFCSEIIFPLHGLADDIQQEYVNKGKLTSYDLEEGSDRGLTNSINSSLSDNMIYDENTGILTVNYGEFKSEGLNIDPNAVNKIILKPGVTFPDDSSFLFSKFVNVVEIDGINQVNTSNIYNMNSMFRDAKSLTMLDLSSWNTSKVTDMNAMFFNASSLVSIDCNSWDTSNVTDINALFANTSSLRNVNLGSWNTSNVKRMSLVFLGAKSLAALNLGSWNTSNVTEMSLMFYGATALTNLNIGSFDNSKVSIADNMFGFLTNLNEIKMGSNFNTSEFGNSKINLPNISTASGKYTGRWIGNNTNKIYSSSDDFINNYDQSLPDTYIREVLIIKGRDVTAKYLDTEGNKISEDVVRSGNIGDNYTTDQKAIDGYTFKEVQGKTTGVFTDQAQSITYVYTKDPVAGGNVTAKYLDAEGNKISEDVVRSGNIGDNYTTDQKAIDGYTFKEVQGKTTGVF
uniref:BspA family leucine-rich repeat surface protein n=1 Tax=Lactococcus lactis TaxID=1358 RepID=UPI0024A9D236